MKAIKTTPTISLMRSTESLGDEPMAIPQDNHLTGRSVPNEARLGNKIWRIYPEAPLQVDVFPVFAIFGDYATRTMPYKERKMEFPGIFIESNAVIAVIANGMAANRPSAASSRWNAAVSAGNCGSPLFTGSRWGSCRPAGRRRRTGCHREGSAEWPGSRTGRVRGQAHNKTRGLCRRA